MKESGAGVAGFPGPQQNTSGDQGNIESAI